MHIRYALTPQVPTELYLHLQCMLDAVRAVTTPPPISPCVLNRASPIPSPAVQVVFSYSPSPTVPPVLRGLSFLAPGGRSVAVVGSTGSGKSTLLRYAHT